MSDQQTLYSTRPDAVQAEIINPIEASGVVEDASAEYDTEGIADAILVWDDAYDEDQHVHHLDRQGYRVRPEYLDAPDGVASFWDLVERHAL